MPFKMHFPLFEQASAGEEGGASSGAVPAAKPEVFSREYVQELRAENATYRTKAKDAATVAEEAKAAAAKAAEEAEAKIKQSHDAANDRIIRAEMKAAALKAGMVDLDGLKLADLTKVKLNDAGEVEGADDLMKELKEAKPYLFQSSSSTSSTEKKPEKKTDAAKTATEMDAKEWAAEKRKYGLR